MGEVGYIRGITGPYDFRVAENTDGIAEFDNKNGINCEMRNNNREPTWEARHERCVSAFYPFNPHRLQPAFSVFVHRTGRVSAVAPDQRPANLPSPSWLTA